MIGQPISRVDGPLKVAGQATYSYEEWGVGQPLYGFIAGATIGHGRITRIETARAERSAGVRRVFTHRNMPPQHDPDMSVAWGHLRALPVLKRPEIQMYGEPVALVVASTLEQARAAAALVDVTYEIEEARYDLASNVGHTFTPERLQGLFEADSVIGDLDAAFAAAPVKVDQLYTTPYVFSQPMEPHSCVAVWKGDVVTIFVGSQTLAWARSRIVATLGLEPRQVKVISRYVGGGFGSKLGVHAEALLAIIAARELQQPVKISMTRQQMFHLVGHRPASQQHVRLGADRDGRLIAFGHDVIMQASYESDYIEQTASVGRGLYAAPNRKTTHRGVKLHVKAGEDVRAPGDAPGLLAIESAMDELAHTLDLDPIELRIKNEPAQHPELGVPFSDHRLVECMREGARRFGWERRHRVPASVRDGQWLIGYGMSAATRGHYQGATSVRVQLDPSANAIVQSDMTDIGTGTYTILTQVAAEALGLPLDRVRVELGDSDFPESAGSGGSWGAANSSTATVRACRALRDKLLASVQDDARSPLRGLDPSQAVLADGRIAIGDASEALTEIIARHFPAGVDAIGSLPMMFDEPSYKETSINSYAAHFAEVRVDAVTGEIRLHSMLGVFEAGRIFNPKTARSQLIGGMTFGVGNALLEEGLLDPRSGAFMNRDLAQYLVPVHADIPAIDAILLDGFDAKANELGAKGLGELGICGAGAAVANAVFNATGVRVRDFPITLEKLLPGLPRQTA